MQLVDTADAHAVGALLLPTLGPQDDQRAGDECGGDRHRREKPRLDRSAEREPQQCGRQEGDQQIEREALRPTLVPEAANDCVKTGAVFPADGDDRAGLDHDLE